MNEVFHVPETVWQMPDVHRVLYIDEQWRYVTAGFRRYSTESGPDPVKTSTHHLGTNIVLRGNGLYTDAQGREHALHPGCFFQRLPHSTHQTRFFVESNYAECFLSLDVHTATMLTPLRLIEPLEVADAGLNQLALDEFLGLLNVLRSTEAAVASPMVLMHILNFLNGLYHRARTAQTDAASTLARAACVILGRDPQKRVSMDYVARELGVSYPTLRRIFLRKIGLTPGEYRIRSRIQYSCNLLLSHSVKEVAQLLGYNDAFTFSAQFKKVVGQPPRTFKQNATRISQ